MQPSTRLYAWEGIDASGARQHGQQPGRSPAFVQAWLQRQGIRATRVSLAGGLRWRWPQRAAKADAAGFSRQLATLLTAGVPLLQAFEVMARSTVDSGMAALLARLKQDVAAGLGLADALQRHPAWFDALYCNLVRVGEQSGTLDRQLEQMAGMLEKRQALRQKVRKAMLYPALLLLTGLGVAALLLLEVVPRFQGLFASFDKALPAFTQWVIDLSTGLGNHVGWLVLLITVLGLAGGRFIGGICRRGCGWCAGAAGAGARHLARAGGVGAVCAQPGYFLYSGCGVAGCAGNGGAGQWQLPA